MAVPFLIPLPLLIAVPLILLIATVGAPALPRFVARRRQAAYDAAVAPNMVRLELTVGRGRSTGPEAAIAAIRGLHPGRRTGVDRPWPRGWPPVELRVVWRDGELHWQLEAASGELDRAEATLASLYPGLETAEVDRSDRPAVYSAVGRLRRSSGLALGEPGSDGANVLPRLATILRSQSDDAEVRLRLLARPMDPAAWQRSLYPEDASASFGQILREAIVSVILNRESSDRVRSAPVLPAPELEARTRKRKGIAGFAVGLLLEVAGRTPARPVVPVAEKEPRVSCLIGQASDLGVALCACRHHRSHLGKACDAPMEICMTFNGVADSLIRHGFARRADAAETLDLLDVAWGRDLVQFGENVREGVNFICNCCGCCCEALIAARKFGIMHPVHTTHYMPRIQLDVCNGCGKCANICPVEAMTLVSANDPHKPNKRKAKLDA